MSSGVQMLIRRKLQHSDLYAQHQNGSNFYCFGSKNIIWLLCKMQNEHFRYSILLIVQGRF